MVFPNDWPIISEERYWEVKGIEEYHWSLKHNNCGTVKEAETKSERLQLRQQVQTPLSRSCAVNEREDKEGKS